MPVSPVVILGAGINGCAVARELAINGVPVWLIDSHDIAYGATARSSRLIHGGLRYLEYRDFALVRESLAERERLLKTAPQFVTPLRLRIPVNGLWGGLWSGALKFSGLSGTALGQRLLPSRSASVRGMLAVSFGLEIYDWLAGRSSLPGHRVLRADHSSGLASEKRWLCEYSDCQMLYPERFVLALLADGQRAASVYQRDFEIRLGNTVSCTEGALRVSPNGAALAGQLAAERLEPSFIINATGAWGDATLQSLGQPESSLFAGTKGTHLYSHSPALKEALSGYGVYAEANDGRLVFILPCGDGTLIGTTDELFEGNPGAATATPSDISYLLSMVNDIFPKVALSESDVEMHHAGVRPLPNVASSTTSAIPRGHSIEPTTLQGIPALTLVGGKLTTCRALAAEVTDIVLQRLGLPRRESSHHRLVPGAEAFPSNEQERRRLFEGLARNYQLSPQQVASVWSFVGNRFGEIFTPASTSPANRDDDSVRPSLIGTHIPIEFVRWSIQTEWAQTLDDLVERRLLLIFERDLSIQTLRALANELVAANKIFPSDVEAAIAATQNRLHAVYGKRVGDSELPSVSTLM